MCSSCKRRRSQITRWDDVGASCASIEGASQRVQEDTLKFAEGIQDVYRDTIEAFFAILIFAPLLAEIGTKVAPAYVPSWLVSSWLVYFAIGLALIGILVASIVAQKLLHIDVKNQMVEAAYRKQLVLAERGPATGCHSAAQRDSFSTSDAPPESSLFRTASWARLFVPVAEPQGSLIDTLEPLLLHLRSNYTSLYNNFIPIDLWNNFYARTLMFTLPTLLTAPYMFVDGAGIGFGDLRLLAFVFDDIFVSLNSFARHWPKINELRATAIRLRTFELAMEQSENPGSEHVMDVDREKRPELL